MSIDLIILIGIIALAFSFVLGGTKGRDEDGEDTYNPNNDK